VTFLVPTMLNRIVNLPEDVRARYDLSSMRIITTGASVCPADLKRKVTELFGPVLYDSYGSTETGLVTIFTPADLSERSESCGRLLDGVEVRVVDDGGNALPRGEVGTIYIRSGTTIGGYLGESTRGDDFTDDGFFTAGDVGRLDAQGYLYILDRKKDMIIAGGVNIYPAEVEAALRAHPAVLDAAVFGVPHADLGEQVLAICERVPGQHVDANELAGFIAGRIAKYKLPRAIEFSDELPRNAAGKVLKRELRAPYWAGTGRAI
jgi:long-chain acyl-CoA synthetase